MSKWWAVGMKGWVELRTHPTEPKVVQSEAKMVLNLSDQLQWGWVGDQFRMLDPIPGRKQPIRLCVTNLRGGKVRGIVKVRRFRRVVGFSVGNNKVAEISEQIAKELINGKPRKVKAPVEEANTGPAGA